MSIDELTSALAAAQAEFPTINKGHTNPHFKSKYADLSDVLAAVRPVLAKHGIAVLQPIHTDESGVFLYTELRGHGSILQSQIPLYLADMTPQQLGSTLTYYRRYTLSSMLGVAAEDDDDGNAAQTAPARPATVTSSQAPPDDWETRPLATMTMRELLGVAEKLGHTFSGGSKAELIRQLEPLVRAMSGAEPWPLDDETSSPTAPPPPGYPHDKPFEPVVAPTTFDEDLRNKPPAARQSIRNSMREDG